MRLGHGLTWRFIADQGSQAWLGKLAAIMELEHGNSETCPTVKFVQADFPAFRTLGRKRKQSLPAWEGLPKSGWRYVPLGALSIWHHHTVTDIICEVLTPTYPGLEIVTMCHALHAVYPGVLKNGGLPLHAALLARGHYGVVLVGEGGAGKTTCCQSVTVPWVALSDDASLILPASGDAYCAHPFPTWSEHLQRRCDLTWNVERCVSLKAVFFLKQGPCDEAIPVGPGEAALRLNHAASYLCGRRLPHRDPSEKTRETRVLFDNCCQMSETIPAFTLRVKLGGRFLEQIDKVLSHVA